MPSVQNLPQWLNHRAAGVLLHPSSLPGGYGIGCLGQSARDWIDFLSDAGFSYWQMCPVGPTGFGDSPYQVFSSSAGNPYFIDWEPLISLGYIRNEDLHSINHFAPFQVDYGSLWETFFRSCGLHTEISLRIHSLLKRSTAASMNLKKYIPAGLIPLQNFKLSRPRMI